MVIYTIFLTNQVINKKGSNTNISTTIRDLQDNPEKHQPGLGSFKFMVGFGEYNRNVFYNESYFKIEMYQTTFDRSGYSINYTFAPLETKFWDKETLGLVDRAIARQSDAIRCPKYDNYTLSGTFASDTLKYLDIVVRRCTPILGDLN